MAQQLAAAASIFGGHQVYLLEDFNGSLGNVLKIAQWSSDHIQDARWG